ncbi:Eco57I restriction-modification methylase domain-containing protein [Bifidobacterium subtile]|jgi:hypothetical protein|uniref:Eco57I restriction-modification methylase domain-containing protein n=1 Tax=Bifidobacterium subtile TaxID=77635 RepID=UPI002F35C91B
MSANDLDETFPGLESVNGFYTPYYMQEFFADSVKTAAERWKSMSAESRPQAQLRAQRTAFAEIVNGEANLLTGEAIGDFLDGVLRALGYEPRGVAMLTDMNREEIPVHLQVGDAQGNPQLQVLVSLSDDAESGILESPVEGLAEGPSMTCEECARRLLSDFDKPTRWILALGLHQAALIDRRKWGEKQCLLFDFDTIFSRNEPQVYEAMAVLLHRSSLCPDEGDSVLDSFDDESSRQSVAVSDSLRSALRECVEILGNEVIHDWTENKHCNVDDIDASDLTVQCLRYMYRLLFLLFIEAKPDLGYAPMKSEAYRTAYSLESLRDIAEQMRGRMDEASGTTYLAETLRRLDQLVFDGYPFDNRDLVRLMGMDTVNAVFAVPPLKAHIFDPNRTGLIEKAQLRDSVMLQIVDLMSVTNAGQQSGRGRRQRKQRISYAALGINQMGAVYEALLSYRGFIAHEKLYEVKRAKDRFDPLNVGYFVTEAELSDYHEDERVRYESGPHRGELRTYSQGTFIYRLAGRERETSASFYTPDSLAQCLVKYALRELKPRIHQATDILSLKICEPAMGSATFLNETINQLAQTYLALREKERIAAEGPQAAIPAERRQIELQRVKMFIADRNIYGVDLNPVAVELGEVSLWLNTICEGAFVPWFGMQLVCGNSLVGARRAGYLESELKEKTKNRRWYEKAPQRIRFDTSSSRTKRVYQFFVGDPGMCSYDDKIVNNVEGDNLGIIKEWKKNFTASYSADEVGAMRQLSKVADELWRGQIATRMGLAKETRDALAVYGYDDSASQKDEQQIARGQMAFDDVQERKVKLTIRQKDEMMTDSYRSEHAKNASEYARLKLAMDYWCALWFWPIEHADKLPTRHQYLADMSLILTGEIPDNGFRLAYMDTQLTFDQAAQSDDAREYMRDHKVNLAELRSSNDSVGERMRLVEKIAKEQHFFHWELEFADVFKDGGFDFMVGNPPWVNVHWSETDAISDVNPLFAIHSMNAAEMNRGLPKLLESPQVRRVFLGEYVGVAGALAFYGATSNYPLLQGQRTNLFRCFLPNAWDYTSSQTGVSAFIHPDEPYGDNRAGALREQMYRRLCKHFQFQNRLNLFTGVDSNAQFSLNIYCNADMDRIGFDSIWNLYSPSTIDSCYESDGSGDMPGTKDENLNWAVKGHKGRIIYIGQKELEVFSRLLCNGTNTSWTQAPLVAVHADSLISCLEAMASFHSLSAFEDEITYSQIWNETNSRKDGTIKDAIHFPNNGSEIIYSSPFIGVGNPYMQGAKKDWKTRNDYDFVDLNDIGDTFYPRIKYDRACSETEYRRRMPKMKDGSAFDGVYRLCCRRMVNLVSERTLQVACVHPGVAWVHTITGYGVHPEHYDLLSLVSGLHASLPYDFLVRAIGKMDVHRSTVELLPLPESTCLANEIRLRGLLLNCLTRPYADLWESCWDDSYTSMSWAKSDSRLTPETFTDLTSQWGWHTPLRTDYERRQALVELDVLASMALGITLDELIDIYRLTFTVLKGYEDDTWYDAQGRIAFSKKNYGDLIYKRADFNRIRNAKTGEIFTRTIMDDTKPGGPCKRTIAYAAPFDKCDRIDDYAAAWAFFEDKYVDQLAQEREERTRRQAARGEQR